MKKVIISVADRSKIKSYERFSSIVFVSKYLNLVVLELSDTHLEKLENDPNVLSISESVEGQYLPATQVC